MTVIAPVLSDDADTEVAVIANDGWFPDVDPAHFRDQLRVRDSVTPARAREALIGAIIHVADELANWRAATGAASLATVPAPTVGGESRLVHLYRRAIYCTAKAELVERYRDTDMSQSGQRKAEDLDPAIGELRRDALHAIRDMLKVGRTTVELI